MQPRFSYKIALIALGVILNIITIVYYLWEQSAVSTSSPFFMSVFFQGFLLALGSALIVFNTFSISERSSMPAKIFQVIANALMVVALTYSIIFVEVLYIWSNM